MKPPIIEPEFKNNTNININININIMGVRCARMY